MTKDKGDIPTPADVSIESLATIYCQVQFGDPAKYENNDQRIRYGNCLEDFKAGYAAAKDGQADYWVSVKDRLPDVKPGHAFEVIINSHVENGLPKNAVLCGVFYNNNFYICAEWEGGDTDAITPIMKGRISHWMPLPVPPNESKSRERE